MARILIGNIKGPQGIQGPKGATGPIGPAGPQGPLPPLINNGLATQAGVAALDAVMGKTLTEGITQLNSEMASDLVKKRQPSNTNPNTIMETDIRSINGWDSTIQDIIPAVLRNQWLLCVTTSPYASNSEALCQILIGTNIAAYASRNMDINGNWTTWKISDTIRSKDYTTSSLALSADSYNVLADLSALAGKEIIGVAVKEIQVPPSGNQNFYASVYAYNNEIRAVVSISQYYAFKVSVLYR